MATSLLGINFFFNICIGTQNRPCVYVTLFGGSWVYGVMPVLRCYRSLYNTNIRILIFVIIPDSFMFSTSRLKFFWRSACMASSISTLNQGKNWRGLWRVRPPWSSGQLLWKNVIMGLGSGLDNSQLNKSLTHSNFRYFTFFGGKYQNSTPLERFNPPWKKFNFYPALNLSPCSFNFNVSNSVDLPCSLYVHFNLTDINPLVPDFFAISANFSAPL